MVNSASTQWFFCQTPEEYKKQAEEYDRLYGTHYAKFDSFYAYMDESARQTKLIIAFHNKYCQAHNLTGNVRELFHLYENSDDYKQYCLENKIDNEL